MFSHPGQSEPANTEGLDRLLEALWIGAEQMVRADDFASAIPEVLSRLGPALRADLIVYEDLAPGPDGEFLSRRRACWVAPGSRTGRGIESPEPVPMRAAGRGTILDRLLRGELVEGAWEDREDETERPFPERGLRDYLAVPVLGQEGRLRGMLACGRTGVSPAWTRNEAETLRLIGHLAGFLSSRQEAQKALALSEDRYRRVVDAAREYVWETDATGTFTFVSDRVHEVLGYLPQEVVGRNPFDFLPPDEAERIRRVFEAVASAKKPIEDLETHALHRDGREVWILSNGIPRLGSDGGLRGYLGTTADISDRKRAEQTLRASEERYRSLVESQSDLIMRWSPDGRLTFANEAFCRFFGYEREQIIGRRMLESARPADRKTVARLAEQLSRPPYGPAIEERAPSVNGPRRISWSAHPVRDETGRLLEMQSIGRDVTDAYRAETELRRKDDILQAISEAAEGLLGTERRADTSDAADPLARLLEKLGRAAEVPRLFLLRTEMLDRGGFALRLERMWLRPGAAEPPPWPEDFIVTPEDGADRFIRLARAERIHDLRVEDAPESMGSLLRDRGVRNLLIVSILVDEEWWGSLVLPSLDAPRQWSPHETEALRISANLIAADIRRRRMQATLQDSEERYRTLVEGASEPILIIDRDGRFRFANRYACEQIRLRPEEIVGRTLWEVHPKGHADGHFAVIRRALESGEATGSTSPTLIAGERRWYSSHVQPLRELGDGREAALIMLRDVTDLKRQEDRILAYQAQLQELASELALTEQRERRRIASGLHDQVGQSLAMARMKLGLARQLLGGAPQERALNEAIDLIEKSIQDTRSLIFELSPPVLHELGLEAALEWLAERHREEGRLEVHFQGDGRPTTMVPEILGFVFQSVQELLVNVVKHARATSVRLRKYRSDHRLAIEVADNGVGYDPAGVGRTDEGFGLFSIRERLRYLGGSLEIESRRKIGTRATIYVPLPEPPPAPEKETGR